MKHEKCKCDSSKEDFELASLIFIIVFFSF